MVSWIGFAILMQSPMLTAEPFLSTIGKMTDRTYFRNWRVAGKFFASLALALGVIGLTCRR